MKQIHTTTTAIRKIKAKAKQIKSELGIQLGKALDLAAIEFGYENYHHVTHCLEKSVKSNSFNGLGSLAFIVEKSKTDWPIYDQEGNQKDSVKIFAGKFGRCLDRKLRDSECRPNSPWKRTGAGRVFMENLQGLPIARRVIREQEVLPSSDVDGQGVEDIKPCRCRPILGQGRTKIFTVESGTRFALEKRKSVNDVTDELDEFMEEIEGAGIGDMTQIPTNNLNQIINKCKKLTAAEPAFVDGYAHWAGALVSLKKHKECIAMAEPVFNAVIELIPKSFNGFIPYDYLSNRPFHRLAVNLILAYYGVEKNNEAKAIAERMLTWWPNDNIGFSFLLNPEE
ncbi:hypothetical protein [Methylomonas sp. AM2-LC]|uniref:hypothetical protein n=1 Tax=Methylomonas sp. AM2-LC TaxID=3153301 RepID=UPI0032637038